MKQKLSILVTLLLMLIIILLSISLYYYSIIQKQSPLQEKDSRLIQLPKANAIVTNIWIEENRINNLKNNNIKYLVVDVGDTTADGKIATPENEIQQFLEMISEFEKTNNYDFILLPYSEINTYAYNIDEEFEDNFISDYLQLINSGFDGVFVDIEPVKIWEETQYLNLLNRLDSKIPEGKILAVYSGAVSDIALRTNEWAWNLGLYRKVSEQADMIFIPGYDFSFDNKEDYEDYMKKQIRKLSSGNFNSYFFLGVPTHKSEPETIGNALEAYNSAKPSENFLGVCIFAEWKTSESEWGVFDSFS